jgi:hypothetical protein
MDDKYECMHTDTAANGQQLSKPSKKQSQYFLNGCSRQQNLLRRPCDDHESVNLLTSHLGTQALRASI